MKIELPENWKVVAGMTLVEGLCVSHECMDRLEKIFKDSNFLPALDSADRKNLVAIIQELRRTRIKLDSLKKKGLIQGDASK